MGKHPPIILLATAMIVVACAAPSTSQSPDQPGIVKETGTGPAQPGGTFQLAVLTSPVSLFPYSDSTIPNNVTSAAIYETLLKYDYAGDYRDEYKLLGQLAEKWERTDPTT